MRIECTKMEWAQLEAILMDGFGHTSTSYENPYFACNVVDNSNEIVFDINGKFVELEIKK